MRLSGGLDWIGSDVVIGDDESENCYAEHIDEHHQLSILDHLRQ